MAKFPYAIDFPATFSMREPALKAMGINYTLNGTDLELERELGTYSVHEKDVIAFARNPSDPVRLAGVDLHVAQEVVTALHAVYFQRKGSWG